MAKRRNVPVDIDVHEQAVIAAEALGQTLKDFVQDAIKERVQRNLKRIQKAAQDRSEIVKRLVRGNE